MTTKAARAYKVEIAANKLTTNYNVRLRTKCYTDKNTLKRHLKPPHLNSRANGQQRPHVPEFKSFLQCMSPSLLLTNSVESTLSILKHNNASILINNSTGRAQKETAIRRQSCLLGLVELTTQSRVEHS